MCPPQLTNAPDVVTTAAAFGSATVLLVVVIVVIAIVQLMHLLLRHTWTPSRDGDTLAVTFTHAMTQ